VALLKIQAPTERVSARAAGQAAPGIVPRSGAMAALPVGAGDRGAPTPDGSTMRGFLDASVKEYSVRSVCCTPIFVIPLPVPPTWDLGTPQESHSSGPPRRLRQGSRESWSHCTWSTSTRSL
jgi:hypothetical protein